MTCSDDAMMLVAGAILVAGLILVLCAVIFWPIERDRIRIDVMAEPHGDQPRLPS